MNIHEMSDKYAISVRKLRRLEKDGHLRVDSSESAIVSEMRSYLNKGNPLPAKHLLALYEAPLIRLELGKQAPKADRELYALGDARSHAATLQIIGQIPDAAEGSAEAISLVKRWLWAILTDAKGPANHAWIAVRVLIDCPENMRAQITPYISRALLNVRKCDDFADWWRVERIAGKNLTIYEKPVRISLDL